MLSSEIVTFEFVAVLPPFVSGVLSSGIVTVLWVEAALLVVLPEEAVPLASGTSSFGTTVVPPAVVPPAVVPPGPDGVTPDPDVPPTDLPAPQAPPGG